MPKVVELIETTVHIGNGETTPVRNVKALYTLEGDLVACSDNHLNEQIVTLIDLLMDDCKNEQLLNNVKTMLDEHHRL